MVWLSDGEKNCEDMFIRFYRMYERDRHIHRQTDRQTHAHTPHDSIGRACIASRGKNHMHTKYKNGRL